MTRLRMERIRRTVLSRRLGDALQQLQCTGREAHKGDSVLHGASPAAAAGQLLRGPHSNKQPQRQDQRHGGSSSQHPGDLSGHQQQQSAAFTQLLQQHQQLHEQLLQSIRGSTCCSTTNSSSNSNDSNTHATITARSSSSCRSFSSPLQHSLCAGHQPGLLARQQQLHLPVASPVDGAAGVGSVRCSSSSRDTVVPVAAAVAAAAHAPAEAAAADTDHQPLGMLAATDAVGTSGRGHSSSLDSSSALHQGQDQGPGVSQPPHLEPYQAAAVDAVLSQLKPTQQRLTLQLPPSAAVNPIITHLTSHFVQSHVVVILSSSSARAAALKAVLTPLLNPQAGSAQLEQGIGPRVVPGELVKPQHKVLIADLEQLQNLPGAHAALLQLQHAKQGIAILEDGFSNPQDLPLQQQQQQPGGGAYHDTGPEQQQVCTLHTMSGAQAVAEQLLRQLRFLQAQNQAADPNRLLVCITSKAWQQQLLMPAQDSRAAQRNNTSNTDHGFKLPKFKLSYTEALDAGLLRAASAIKLPVYTQVPAELVAAADAAMVHAEPSCGSAPSTSTMQQHAAVDALGSFLMSNKAAAQRIAAAVRAVSSGGKGLVYASGQDHARQLAVELNLQGISSLTLHEGQGPQDQAAVLDAFAAGNDRVLVASSSCAAVVGAAGLGVPLSCVLMTVPTCSREVYAALVAPGLLPGFADLTAGSSSSSTSTSRSEQESCLVVDFCWQGQPGSTAESAGSPVAVAPAAGTPAGQAAAAATTAAGNAAKGRRRRSQTARAGPTEALAGAAAAPAVQPPAPPAASAPAAAGGGEGAIGAAALSCPDVLGPSNCQLLPVPDALAAAWADESTSSQRGLSSSSSSSSGSSAAATANGTHPSSSSKGNLPLTSQTGISGDLVWAICSDGSWAIPIKRGYGRSMVGLRVLWLTKAKRGFLAQVEQGLGQLTPLPGTNGKPMTLQKGRLLAEAWLKATYPMEASIRELGMDWRDRRMSDSQVIFCERYGIPYDPEWTRGIANNMIDKFVVEEMRHPITERQAFLLRHFGPYAPSYVLNHHSSAMSYSHTAGLLTQAILQGHLTIGSNAAAGDSAGSSGGQAAAVASGKAARAPAGPQPGEAGAVGADGVLLPRKTLLREQEALYDAGLRPKYTWMLLRGGADLLLDLMTGCYLWLSKADNPTPSLQQQQQQQQEEEGQQQTQHSDPSAYDDLPLAAAVTASGALASSSSSSSRGAAGGLTHAPSLDTSALYTLTLQLPDSTMHPVGTAAAALQLIRAYEQQQQQQQQQDADDRTTTDTASSNTGSSSSNTGSSSKPGPLPLPLPAALERAERLAAALASNQAAFLGRGHAVRLAGMVGGWRVPLKSSEAHPCLPATTRHLDQLREAGLPSSRRFTCLDAHREWLRHVKTHNLPEPPCTPSQLARIRELNLPLPDAAAAALTHAQAKAMLYRAQLATEAQVAADRKGVEQQRFRAKSAWVLSPAAAQTRKKQSW